MVVDEMNQDICHCGDYMDDHTVYSGHNPVSIHDSQEMAIEEWLEKFGNDGADWSNYEEEA